MFAAEHALHTSRAMRLLLLACVLCLQALPASADVAHHEMKVPWRAARTHVWMHSERATVRVGEDFVVRAGDVRLIHVEPPAKESWSGSFIVMWDPHDGALDVSGVTADGRVVGPIVLQGEPGTAIVDARNAVRITANRRIPYRVRYEGQRVLHQYCCPSCVVPRTTNCEPESWFAR